MTRKYELEQEKAKWESQVEDICCDLAEFQLTKKSRELLTSTRDRLVQRLRDIQNELDLADGKPLPVDVSDRDAPYLLQCEGAE